jgi:hypothetical protein
LHTHPLDSLGGNLTVRREVAEIAAGGEIDQEECQQCDEGRDDERITQPHQDRRKGHERCNQTVIAVDDNAGAGSQPR